MSKILITVLGKASLKEGSSAYNYRDATYLFKDSPTRECKTDFFAYAIIKSAQYDKMVVFGTEKSMWLSNSVSKVEESVELWSQIDDESKEAGGIFTQSHLNTLQSIYKDSLGIDVSLNFIDYSKNEEEQLNLIESIASHVQPGDEVTLDITHGLRHHPLLMLVAARYLQKTKKVNIAHIYYGAFELKDEGVTPVIDLSGILKMMDYIDAYSTYQNTGDLRFIADLVANKDLKTTLQKAAFTEKTGNLKGSSQEIKSLVAKNGHFSKELGPFNLIKEKLSEDLSWASSDDLYSQQIKLAGNHLDKRNYIKATSYLNEAITSSLFMKYPTKSSVLSNTNQFEKTEKVSDALAIIRNSNKELLSCHDYKSREALEILFLDKDETVKNIKSIRNALCHMTSARYKQSASYLASEESLRDFLNKAIKDIKKRCTKLELVI